MKAVQDLKVEHQLINRVLTVMEREVTRIDQGRLLRTELIDDLVTFFQSFADKRHHGKEERLLFPLLASKKAIIRDGPVKVLTSEHESGRYFVKELHEASLGLRQKNPSALARLRRALTLFAQLLRKHIAKEEEILFLLAEVLLSDAEERKLAKDFEAAGKEMTVQELSDLHSLVERLEIDVPPS